MYNILRSLMLRMCIGAISVVPSCHRCSHVYFDPAYIRFALPALLLSLYATVLTKSRFARYSQVEPSSGMTGADGARTLLDRQGLRDAAAEQTGEFLSGHYDPSSRVLRLSSEVYGTSSLSAAFLTYVTAAVSSLMTLLYYLMRAGLLGGRRND